ncbi:MAG: ABC transporter permease subunit [Acidobacteriota bacterium]
MSLYDIRLLYIRELRAALRERGIVINSLLVPLLLYPVMIWVIFSGIAFIKGSEERLPSRMLLDGVPAAHGDLTDLFGADDRVDLVAQVPGGAGPEQAVRDGDLDLWAQFSAVPTDGGPVNFTVDVVHNSSMDRSDRALRRFESQLEDYRATWREQVASEMGLGPAQWLGFEVALENTATGEDVGAFLLGLMVPMFMMMMISIGCFYPAVDATAGERERSTWETSLTLGVDHGSVLIAKYLYVATLGAIAGFLNLIALSISMAALLRPLLGSDAVSFQIPWRALPVIGIGTFAFALMVAAAMMLFAIFARTFKEGQAMIGPAYILSLLPPILVTSPDLELNVKWALVPVCNVCLLFRQAIGGEINWALAALVILVQTLAIAALLAAVRRVLSSEQVVVGGFEGSLGTWIGRRMKRRTQETRHGQ